MDTNKAIQRIAKAQTRTQIAEIMGEVNAQIQKELTPILAQIELLQAQKEGINASLEILQTFAQTKLNTLQSTGETDENQD